MNRTYQKTQSIIKKNKILKILSTTPYPKVGAKSMNLNNISNNITKNKSNLFTETNR